MPWRLDERTMLYAIKSPLFSSDSRYKPNNRFASDILTSSPSLSISISPLETRNGYSFIKFQFGENGSGIAINIRLIFIYFVSTIMKRIIIIAGEREREGRHCRMNALGWWCRTFKSTARPWVRGTVQPLGETGFCTAQTLLSISHARKISFESYYKYGINCKSNV